MQPSPRTAVPLGACCHREGLSAPPKVCSPPSSPSRCCGQWYTRPSARVSGLSAALMREGCAGAARVRPSPAAHAMRGAARAATHAHDRWARGLGRGALTALRITIPPCTTAAPAGGAHAGGVCAGAPWRLLVESSRAEWTSPFSARMFCSRLGQGGEGGGGFPCTRPQRRPPGRVCPPRRPPGV